jgi:predicted nucleic acid-binding protein
VSTTVYDAAVLIAAERNDRRVWADHKARLLLGIVPVVPAAVVAQVSRSPRQVQLRRLLRGCVVVPLDERGAHEAGRLLGITRTTDVVDATVVAVAATRGGTVVTGDGNDIARLVLASGVELAIEDV